MVEAPPRKKAVSSDSSALWVTESPLEAESYFCGPSFFYFLSHSYSSAPGISCKGKATLFFFFLSLSQFHKKARPFKLLIYFSSVAVHDSTRPCPDLRVCVLPVLSVTVRVCCGKEEEEEELYLFLYIFFTLFYICACFWLPERKITHTTTTTTTTIQSASRPSRRVAARARRWTCLITSFLSGFFHVFHLQRRHHNFLPQKFVLQIPLRPFHRRPSEVYTLA